MSLTVIMVEITQEVRLLRNLDHDYGQRHCEARHTAKERSGADEREDTRVDPFFVRRWVHTEYIDHKHSNDAAVQRTNEKHRHNKSARNSSASRPTREGEIDEKHDEEGR